MNRNYLALSRPSTFHKNFNGALLRNVYYPIALAEKLHRNEMNAGQPDIICRFNSNFSWYFGTDGNTPSTRYDFVTAVLHEMAHGFGFSGFFNDNGQAGYFDNNSNLPSVYDYFIFNVVGQQLADESLFSRPSFQLHEELTSGELKISSEISENPLWIYAPQNWHSGSSIYHLERGNGLMDPYTHKGEAIHTPEEETLEILSRIGWESVVFNFEAFSDFEKGVVELPVEVGIDSEIDVQNASMEVIFSKDYFMSLESVSLEFDQAREAFTGAIPLNFFQGNVQYYFKLTTAGNRTCTHPSGAPAKKFSLRIGPDYSAPSIIHNPLNIVSKNTPEVSFSAWVSDNLGINSVKIEYNVDGIPGEPIVLKNEKEDIYQGILVLNNLSFTGDVLEYRIVAEDQSARGNKRYLPADGYYRVNVFQPALPVHSYSSDFERGKNDFYTSGFSVSSAPGFGSNILHSSHPYPASALENEKLNLIAQLKFPLILEENGEMIFEEVVLVEPGQAASSYTDEMFWDYVIIEGSGDGGASWHPVVDGYDSGTETSWLSHYKSSMANNNSNAEGHESMFRTHVIPLTENEYFSAGDTVLFRFRLASDQTINGWGWAIDDLQIQEKSLFTSRNAFAKQEMHAYPNPFDEHFFVDCSGIGDMAQAEIVVTDLYGKSVFHQTGIDAGFSPKTRVDLADNSPGLYIVKLSDGHSIVSTQKMIKK